MLPPGAVAGGGHRADRKRGQDRERRAPGVGVGEERLRAGRPGSRGSAAPRRTAGGRARTRTGCAGTDVREQVTASGSPSWTLREEHPEPAADHDDRSSRRPARSRSTGSAAAARGRSGCRGRGSPPATKNEPRHAQAIMPLGCPGAPGRRPRSSTTRSRQIPNRRGARTLPALEQHGGQERGGHERPDEHREPEQPPQRQQAEDARRPASRGGSACPEARLSSTRAADVGI